MKTRIIHTQFWTDSYVQELNPKEKLLFIFLISNDKVNMIGVYEMNVGLIQYLTSLSKKDVEDGLALFQSDLKIAHIDNYVILLNHLKYQDYSKGSERQKQAFQREIDLLPEHIKEIALGRDDLTSLQLVSNQLETIHKSKNINNNIKYINNNNKEKKESFENELEQVLNKWNFVMGTSLTSTRAIQGNYEIWRKEYELQDILNAIEVIPTHEFWSDKMKLPTFFRTRNKNGDCDYIAEMLSYNPQLTNINSKVTVIS